MVFWSSLFPVKSIKFEFFYYFYLKLRKNGVEYMTTQKLRMLSKSIYAKNVEEFEKMI